MAKTPAFQAGTPAGSSPVIWSRTQIGLATYIRLKPRVTRKIAKA